MFRRRKVRRFDEFRRHLFNARKEVLLSVKSIVDSRIRNIEEMIDELERMKKKAEKKPAGAA